MHYLDCQIDLLLTLLNAQPHHYYFRCYHWHCHRKYNRPLTHRVMTMEDRRWVERLVGRWVDLMVEKLADEKAVQLAAKMVGVTAVHLVA